MAKTGVISKHVAAYNSCIQGAGKGNGTLYSVYHENGGRGLGNVYHWVEGYDPPQNDPRNEPGAVTLCSGEEHPLSSKRIAKGATKVFQESSKYPTLSKPYETPAGQPVGDNQMGQTMFMSTDNTTNPISYVKKPSSKKKKMKRGGIQMKGQSPGGFIPCLGMNNMDRCNQCGCNWLEGGGGQIIDNLPYQGACFGWAGTDLLSTCTYGSNIHMKRGGPIGVSKGIESGPSMTTHPHITKQNRNLNFNNRPIQSRKSMGMGGRTKPIIDNSSRRGDRNKLQGGGNTPCPVGTTRGADGTCIK